MLRKLFGRNRITKPKPDPKPEVRCEHCGWIALICLALVGCTGHGESAETVAPQTGHQPVIVFIGDSITAGWNLPADITNVGIAGQWSEQMLARFDQDVLSKQPSVVEILAGTNDVRRFEFPTIDYISTMADKAAASGACVIIGTVPPNAEWSVGVSAEWGGKSLLRFNDQLRALAAAHGYLLADYYRVLIRDDGVIDLQFFPDRIHPNDEGHARMWAVVAPFIERCEAGIHS